MTWLLWLAATSGTTSLLVLATATAAARTPRHGRPHPNQQPRKDHHR